MMNLELDAPRCPVCHEELEPQEWEDPEIVLDNGRDEYVVRVWARCHHCQKDYTVVEHYEYIGHEPPEVVED